MSENSKIKKTICKSFNHLQVVVAMWLQFTNKTSFSGGGGTVQVFSEKCGDLVSKCNWAKTSAFLETPVYNICIAYNIQQIIFTYVIKWFLLGFLLKFVKTVIDANQILKFVIIHWFIDLLYVDWVIHDAYIRFLVLCAQ